MQKMKEKSLEIASALSAAKHWLWPYRPCRPYLLQQYHHHHHFEEKHMQFLVPQKNSCGQRIFNVSYILVVLRTKKAWPNWKTIQSVLPINVKTFSKNFQIKCYSPQKSNRISPITSFSHVLMISGES